MQVTTAGRLAANNIRGQQDTPSAVPTKTSMDLMLQLPHRDCWAWRATLEKLEHHTVGFSWPGGR